MSEESDREQTRVGHWYHDECDVYAGRGSGDRHINNTVPGTRGWLGNPFTVEANGREDAIRLYRALFEQKLEDDETFRMYVAGLSGKVLGCWCQRLDEDEPACHAEIIAEHADRIARDVDTDSSREGSE